MTKAHIQIDCEGCGKTVTFPVAAMGTVQHCPECGGYIDVPEASQIATSYEQQCEIYDRQSEETERQLRRSAAQQEETERQLRRSSEQQDRTQAQLNLRDRLAALEERLLDRAASLLDRWEILAARVDQALSDLKRRDGQ